MTDTWPRCIFMQCPDKHARRSMFCRFHKSARVRNEINDAYDRGFDCGKAQR